MNTIPVEPVYFLLVDDLEENLQALEALLRRDGLVLIKARSGTEALELLLKHEFALALVDVQMPVMDGFELAELMRGTARTSTVPIIFLTAGVADRQRRFRGYEAGAVDFLQKPIEPDVLRSKADVFFELYRQRQQIALQRDRLKESSAALLEADRRKDEFLATLAHELRNPLAPIRNGLEVLRMSPDSPDAAKVRDIMDRQMTHLVRLIDDLMDVSRVIQGKIDLRKEAVTLQDVLQAGIEASRPLIEAGRHQLVLDVPDAPLWLEADITRLAQIVTNLLNNAAKYTPEGGRIVLSVKQGDQIEISVADNGLGIPPDMIKRVFELFTQVDRSLERAQGGLGIGLALVKRLVELHGGNLDAYSAGLGQGSTFTIRLPLPSAALQPVKANDAPVMSSTRPLKVLVVDDNVDSAKTLGWTLEMLEHKPTLAFEGASAVEIAKTLTPDVVLLDIGLPDMDGYDVCRAMHKIPALEKAVFIAQTGWGQPSDRQKAYDAGFDHHLVKPVNFKELSALLAKIQDDTP